MDLSPPHSAIDGTWIGDMLHPRGPWGEKVYQVIEQQIKSLQKQSLQNSAFDQWRKAFSVIYPRNELDHTLYAHHCLLVLIIAPFLNVVTGKGYGELHEAIETPLYFRWMESQPCFITYQQELADIIAQYKVSTTDLFGEIYQDLIANTTRHVQGEFYTPPILCRFMVERSYQLGITVLDPACDSGSFLVAVIQQILHSSVSSQEKALAFDKIYGVDINPLACMICRTNLLLNFHQAGYPFESLVPHIVQANMLLDDFSPVPGFPSEFSLVIGNPPWLVVNGIPSMEDKERLKQLGNELGILRGGKLATSTELTALFWAKLHRDHLLRGGSIHLVIPASLATGAQHALLRQFVGWKDIEFWDFDQDLFRIHNLCVKACKGTQPLLERLQVQWITFHYTDHPPYFTEIGQELYVPSILENKNQKKNQKIKLNKNSKTNLKKHPERKSKLIPTFLTTFIPSVNISAETMRYGDPSLIVGRLIPLKVFQHFYNRELFTIITDAQSSPYVAHFRQGASLVPRNLLFVDKIPINSPSDSKLRLSPNSIRIQPAKSLQSKKYSTWEFEAFSSANIESEYLFSIAKSTGLLSFYYLQNYTAVLPLEPTGLLSSES
ncbi:MAG: hypothetical protein E4G98_01625, partial [Promethearchaeota archaeon]